MTEQPPPEPADATRGAAADERDDAGDLRDGAADLRDVASSWRDVVAARRDAAADERDAVARLREQVGPIHSDAVQGHAEGAYLAAVARRAAAADRLLAGEDRQAGADERELAESDRDTAGEDRGAAAADREHASLDGLTGAYVRGPGLLQLEREVERAQRTSQELTVAFVDVDHLKAVNDAGGHAAGDRLLVRVATALRTRLRPYDVVIRYGGDEFVCVLTGVGSREAEARFMLVNEDLVGHGSVTVGVATAAGDEGGTALVERADAALYAKRARRPQGVAPSPLDTPTGP